MNKKSIIFLVIGIVLVVFIYLFLYSYRLPCGPPVSRIGDKPIHYSSLDTFVSTMRKVLGIKVYPQCPICLSGETLISTPSGKVKIKELSQGIDVWTLDKSGNRVIAEIIRSSSTYLGKKHYMVHVVLEDDRQLLASYGHPTSDGRFFGQLSKGDTLDGSRIVELKIIDTEEPKTYDILPSGETGYYWANGILVGSTLK